MLDKFFFFFFSRNFFFFCQVSLMILLSFFFLSLFCVHEVVDFSRISLGLGSLCIVGLTFNLFLMEFRRLFFSFQAENFAEFPIFFNFDFEFDFLNLSLILLSTFLIIICISISWNYIKVHLIEYLLLFCFLDFILINFFLTTDLLIFFFFFEIVLIPMYLIISVWGSRKRKIHASYVFFFFTLFGSLLMFISIGNLCALFKTSDIFLLHLLLNHLERLNFFSLSILQDLNLTTFPVYFDLIFLKFFWFSFFVGFCVKIPIYPFHIWLPEAHVEASTAGSVILAGILLKMGVYGLFRILLFFFPLLSIYFSPLILVLCLIGILYTSFITLFQNDIKKIIAYSSVSHMGYCVLGLTINSIHGISGSFFIMLSHGLISSLLFILVGSLYERFSTRLVQHYSGLSSFLPQFSFFFLLTLLANMSFPITSGFIGELLVLMGLVEFSLISSILATIGAIFCGFYTIWLYTRICHGPFLATINEVSFFFDVSLREFLIMSLFLFLIFGFGCFPNFFLGSILEFGLRLRY